MKNQYVGDIGDYGKYGLLRFLRGRGINVGVNWYLTPNDERTDGGHTEYAGIEAMRQYDEELFDKIKPLAEKDKKEKEISMVESSGILEGMRFYNAVMDFDDLPCCERAAKRDEWNKNALAALDGCELIFADPDNGLIKKSPAVKGAQKYILADEIANYYNRGQQVVYYQHRPRISKSAWMAFKTQMLGTLPEAKLLAVSFNRWSCRTYIFVLHEEAYARYKNLLDDFLNTKWGSLKIDGKHAFVHEDI